MRRLVRDDVHPWAVSCVDLGDGVRGLALGLEVEAERLQVTIPPSDVNG